MSLADDFRQWREGILSDVETMIGAVRQVRVADVALAVGAPGSPLAVGDNVFLRLGLNGAATVLTFSLAATVAGAARSGTCVLDVLVGSTLAGAVSICGTNRPSLTAQAERPDLLPTSWVTTIPDPSWLLARVVSTDGVLEVVGLTLRVIVGLDSSVQVLGLASQDKLVNIAGDTLIFGG